MTVEAQWNGVVLAKSDDTVVVEGNHYFPADSLNWDHFRPTDTHSTCHWKGEASYYDVFVDGEANNDAAWHYPETFDAAEAIRGRVAFWKGVSVTET